MIAWRRKGWIGVDVGSHAVKLAQLEQVGAHVRLRAAMVIRRAEPWPSEMERLHEPPTSLPEIRAALALDRAFAGTPAACALPMQLCDVRMFLAPPADELSRRAAIAAELQSLDLGTESDREFDYWESDSPGRTAAGAGDRVHVVSVPKSWTLRAAKDVSRAGLRCEVLDGLPLALARAVGMTRDDRSRPLAVLDWGSNSATFCLIYRGTACFVRPLPQCAFARLATLLQSALGVGQEDTDEILSTVGVPSSSADEPSAEMQPLVGDLLNAPLQELADELQRTFSYLALQHPDLRFDRLLLTGGGATIRHVDEHLSRLLGMSVDVWRMVDERSTDETAPTIPAALLAAAVGLSALAWEAP